MNLTTSFDHRKTLDEFHDKLKDCTQLAVCGRPFVRVAKLQDWLRSNATLQTKHITRQVIAAYRNHAGPLPVPDDDFDAGDRCCLLIFCILHMNGHGDLTHLFSEENKNDRSLPMPFDEAKSVFQTVPHNDAAKLATEFIRDQYRFYPARFAFRQNKTKWSRETVIPICDKKPISEKGGTAKLWHIEIPEEFIEENLRKVSQRSRFNAAARQDCEPDWRYEFALKSFIPRNRKAFEDELKGFYNLRDHDGMIKYLGSFRTVDLNPQGDSRNITIASNNDPYSTCNILLEFADMDLGIYFQNRSPPNLPEEAEGFWKALFAIATAVRDIHDFKEHRGEELREHHGWHSDIKPDNILNVDDIGTGICKFKLADLGFAKFVPKIKSNSPPKCKLEGGTKTYGPPEYSGTGNELVSQAVDIWSLGCVFSLAATWVILGFVGVLQFDEVRMRAIRELQYRDHVSKGTSAEVDGDEFHNGSDVLPSVKQWHVLLRDQARKCDTISTQLLDLVDSKMLVANPDTRIKANELCIQLEDMLNTGLGQQSHSVPMELQAILKDIDADVADKLEELRRSKSSGHETISNQSRIQPKRTTIGGMLKTTHRQSILSMDRKPTRLGRQTTFSTLKEVSLDTVAETPSPIRPPHKSLSEIQINNHTRADSKASEIMPGRSRGPRRSSRQPHHPPENVFQARETVTNSHKDGIWKRPKLFKHTRIDKDKVLENYYDRRDIKFLVDNAMSMRKDWFQATYTLETLVMKAHGLDPDGMDLTFTTGKIKVEGKEEPKAFVQAMKDGYPKEHVATNMVESLSKILNEYIRKLRSRDQTSSSTNTVTLIVLTDGLWDGTTQKEHVKEKIVEFLQELERLRLNNIEFRPFSIEFVQFGHDADATRRLKDLDNFLRKKAGSPGSQDRRDKSKDMIDTEPALGDMNKMLLGSFRPEYDDSEDDDQPETIYWEPDSTSLIHYDQNEASPPGVLASPQGNHTSRILQSPPPQPVYASPRIHLNATLPHFDTTDPIYRLEQAPDSHPEHATQNTRFVH